MKLSTLCLLVCTFLFGMAYADSTACAQSRKETKAPVDDTDDDEEEEADADEDVVSEGGEKVKVYRFSGLDISGRLKSPQLLYFLNRLRAEFDRPRLPHRSFLKEMVRSTKGRSF